MAIHTDALSQVYARSLYELAEQAGSLDKIMEIASELEQVCELARGDQRFAEFLGSPVIDRSSRSEALGRIFRDKITDLLLRFLLVVNDKGRLGHLEAIAASFDQIVQEAHGRVEVDVFTAAPIDGEQLGVIKDRIKTALGKETALHPYTDASMIGGIKLRIGDQLIDGSVATSLRRMKQSLLASGSSAVRERIDRIIENSSNGSGSETGGGG